MRRARAEGGKHRGGNGDTSSRDSLGAYPLLVSPVTACGSSLPSATLAQAHERGRQTIGRVAPVHADSALGGIGVASSEGLDDLAVLARGATDGVGANHRIRAPVALDLVLDGFAQGGQPRIRARARRQSMKLSIQLEELLGVRFGRIGQRE